MLNMRRRDFVMLLGGAAAWPFAARAQKEPARIAFLGSGAEQSSAIFVEAFRQGMRDNDLVEGRDYVLDLRWAEGDYARFPALAGELARRHPALILATTISAVRAAQRAAPTTPIVMTSINDPVGAGLIASLARPGANTTGTANLVQDFTPKLVELLRTTIPTATVIVALFNPANPSNRKLMDSAETASMGVTFQPMELKTPVELDAAFTAVAPQRPDALLVMADATLMDMRERVVTLALRHRLPIISSYPEFTDAGALIGYGPSRRDNYRRCAYYVKKILDGTKPSDLPVEQPTRIELSINLKTAKILHISIPDSVLARADRVLE
jgi:putative ABC transport system substrate-binding protein